MQQSTAQHDTGHHGTPQHELLVCEYHFSSAVTQLLLSGIASHATSCSRFVLIRGCSMSNTRQVPRLS